MAFYVYGHKSITSEGDLVIPDTPPNDKDLICNLNPFIIEKNQYLECNIQAYYRTDYIGYNKPNNPNYINTLKNTYDALPDYELQEAINELDHNLYAELKWILETEFPNNSQVAICTVPRAKSKDFYTYNQLLFREVMKKKAELLSHRYLVENSSITIFDGTEYIIRHTNTKTTHLPREIQNYDNSGDQPYSGIANNTCLFSDEIEDKHILLIDDVYTKTINIDEDFIQALLDRGCKSVIFFAIARTQKQHQPKTSNYSSLKERMQKWM